MAPIESQMIKHQGGFSLVELMVGLTIGLIMLGVILQSMSVFESQNRTTTGTAEAQTNGAIGLYILSRELQQAGYGLSSSVTNSPLTCTTAGMTATLTPATIGNGAGANGSDTITVRYGTAPAGGVASEIGAISGSNVVLGTNFGCQVGDTVILTNGTACAQTTVAALVGTTTVTLANAGSALVGSKLACVGTWNTVIFSIDADGNLVRTLNGVASPILAGIVDIQAQYGISATAKSNVVTQWVDAGGGWAAPTIADRNRIKAIRVAIVGRNDKQESTVVSQVCSSQTAASPSGVCAWEGTSTSPSPQIDLSTGNSDWDHYRYRVFDNTVPLRNVIWSKDSL
jgi:type IV pilus assembly protein PilW